MMTTAEKLKSEKEKTKIENGGWGDSTMIDIRIEQYKSDLQQELKFLESLKGTSVYTSSQYRTDFNKVLERINLIKKELQEMGK